MFILRLALIMVLLIQPAIAKRVSESEFQQMTRAFPPLEGAAVERVDSHEDWEFWSSGFPIIQGTRTCKPVVTGAGGLHISIMSLVKTEKLDDTIVPMTGLKPNDAVLDKVRTALEPHFRTHCQQIGKPIEIWLGFKYADIASSNAEVVYNLTWDGRVIGYRQYPIGTIDASPISSRAFLFGKFVAKEITKRTVALRQDTFFYQLLGGADPSPTPHLMPTFPDGYKAVIALECPAPLTAYWDGNCSAEPSVYMNSKATADETRQQLQSIEACLKAASVVPNICKNKQPGSTITGLRVRIFDKYMNRMFDNVMPLRN